MGTVHVVELSENSFISKQSFNNILMFFCTHNNKESTVENAVDFQSSMLSYAEICSKFFLENQVFVAEVPLKLKYFWYSFKDWSAGSKINTTFLRKTFGEAEAPVVKCDNASTCPTQQRVADYMDYLDGDRKIGMLYLKDWHFKKAFPDYSAYKTPSCFLSDWLNEFWDFRGIAPKSREDDYRFVYIGPKGSRTPYHVDVMHSYSWSANVCGKKRWVFTKPGDENLLKDHLGNFPSDIDSKIQEKNVDATIIVQEPGDVIFVPSGWYHQVENVEDAISINHNWFNAFSVRNVWKFLKGNLSKVKESISDCRGMDEWEQQCQLILKADSAMDYSEFYMLLLAVCVNRLSLLVLLFPTASWTQTIRTVISEQYQFDGYFSLCSHSPFQQPMKSAEKVGNYETDSVPGSPKAFRPEPSAPLCSVCCRLRYHYDVVADGTFVSDPRDSCWEIGVDLFAVSLVLEELSADQDWLQIESCLDGLPTSRALNTLLTEIVSGLQKYDPENYSSLSESLAT